MKTNNILEFQNKGWSVPIITKFTGTTPPYGEGLINITNNYDKPSEMGVIPLEYKCVLTTTSGNKLSQITMPKYGRLTTDYYGDIIGTTSLIYRGTGVKRLSDLDDIINRGPCLIGIDTDASTALGISHSSTGTPTYQGNTFIITHSINMSALKEVYGVLLGGYYVQTLRIPISMYLIPGSDYARTISVYQL